MNFPIKKIGNCVVEVYKAEKLQLVSVYLFISLQMIIFAVYNCAMSADQLLME